MKPNATLLIIVTLLVGGIAYWYFFTGTGNQPPLTATGAPTNQAQMQFETLVGELQPVSFDTSIFSDARFNALTDIATPVAPESLGRLDPLAPLSASVSANVNTNTSMNANTAPAASSPAIAGPNAVATTTSGH